MKKIAFILLLSIFSSQMSTAIAKEVDQSSLKVRKKGKKGKDGRYKKKKGLFGKKKDCDCPKH